MTITKPNKQEYSTYYQTYIDEVKVNDLLQVLVENKKESSAFLRGVAIEKADYRYAEGKWSTKEVISHIIDTERIFAYRALRFARNDKTALAGFDEEQYAPESNAAHRTLISLIEEFEKVRESTVALFTSFSEAMFNRSGLANNNEMSVRSLGFIIVGHGIHHLNVIKEKYLLPSR